MMKKRLFCVYFRFGYTHTPTLGGVSTTRQQTHHPHVCRTLETAHAHEIPSNQMGAVFSPNTAHSQHQRALPQLRVQMGLSVTPLVQTREQCQHTHTRAHMYHKTHDGRERLPFFPLVVIYLVYTLLTFDIAECRHSACAPLIINKKKIGIAYTRWWTYV